MAKPPKIYDDKPDWSGADLVTRDHTAKLKAARARLGLSQNAAAALLGVPATILRNWEQRRTMPDDAAKTLIRLFYEYPNDIRALLAAHAA